MIGIRNAKRFARPIYAQPLQVLTTGRRCESVRLPTDTMPAAVKSNDCWETAWSVAPLPVSTGLADDEASSYGAPWLAGAAPLKPEQTGKAQVHMAERDSEILSDEEAGRLWERAAQLQAEAARRVEAPDVPGAEMGPPGYALTHVRSAALEAGIANEFVDAALADLRAERALPKVEKGNSLARRFLNHPPDTITVRRVVEATPQEVLSAMGAVLPVEPFRLTSTDQQGDPLNRGVLVFDIQGLSAPFPQGFALEAKWGGLRQVFVSLRPIEGSTPSCEMTVHSPVTSHKVGLVQGMIAAAVTGGAGLGVGLLGGALLGALGLAIGIGPVTAVGGVLVGGGLGVKGYRAVYGYCMRRGRRAIEGLIGAVAVRAQGVWQGS